MELLKKISLDEVLFLDIETVSNHAHYSELSEDWQALWEKKSRSFLKENETAQDVYERASIYAEFGKIVVIGLGYFVNYANTHTREFRVTTLKGDEKEILSQFIQLLESSSGSRFTLLAAHNGKEFDFPFLARRMLIHQLKIPPMLDLSGKKPWEIPHIDTMELWKMGEFRHNISLNLLSKLFHIPTPKDDIDGSMVGSVYWQEQDLERIARYCAKDVITLARVVQKLRYDKPIDDNQIVIK